MYRTAYLSDCFLSALQNVGTELKTLMVSVDAEIVDLPVECHTEVSISDIFA